MKKSAMTVEGWKGLKLTFPKKETESAPNPDPEQDPREQPEQPVQEQAQPQIQSMPNVHMNEIQVLVDTLDQIRELHTGLNKRLEQTQDINLVEVRDRVCEALTDVETDLGNALQEARAGPVSQGVDSEPNEYMRTQPDQQTQPQEQPVKPQPKQAPKDITQEEPQEEQQGEMQEQPQEQEEQEEKQVKPQSQYPEKPKKPPYKSALVIEAETTEDREIPPPEGVYLKKVKDTAKSSLLDSNAFKNTVELLPQIELGAIQTESQIRLAGKRKK